MIKQDNKHTISKPTFAYVSFHSIPWVKDENYKLKKHRFAFDFLFLLKDDFAITVFDFIGIKSNFKKKGVRFNYLKRSHNNQAVFPWKLFFKIKKLNPDIVYIQGLSYPHFILVMRLFLKPTNKIIVQDHANSYPKGIKKVLFKMADRLVSNYFFTSKTMAQAYVDTGLISSTEKVIECVEGSTQFSNDPNVIKEKNSFLWVGRLDKNKDPLTILKAFSEYIKEVPTARLTMFYKNVELLEEVKGFIVTNNLENKIVLKGKLPHKELEKWFQKSTYFILGSHKEGGPISLIEAMACGCIPITTNIPAFRSMTNNGECGFLFEPENSKQLFKILVDLKNANLDALRHKVMTKFELEMSHQAIALIINKASRK